MRSENRPRGTERASPRVSADGVVMPRFLSGLSGRILLLTVAIIMFAEIVFFVPAVATMRLRWLDDRLNTAAAAVTVIDGLQPLSLPRALQDETLMATGTKAIVLRKDGMSRAVVTRTSHRKESRGCPRAAA